MPRSASNLLVRMLALEGQPDLIPRQNGGYFFMDAIKKMSALDLRMKHVDDWSPEERAEMKQCYQDCFDAFDEHIKKTDAEGKITFVKEHSAFLLEPTAISKALYPDREVKEEPWTIQRPGVTEVGARSPNNFTMLPDDFLKTFLPIFLIRHPALAFPSLHRKMEELKDAGDVDVSGQPPAQETIMRMKWSRILYDIYRNTSTEDDIWPVVIDADDIINHPEVLVQLCEITGLDKTKLKFSWEPATESELGGMTGLAKAMLSTVIASSGLIKDKAATDLDIDVEAKKWKTEFGESEGGEIEKLVRDAMPDYEFLRSKRMMPKPRKLEKLDI